MGSWKQNDTNGEEFLGKLGKRREIEEFEKSSSDVRISLNSRGLGLLHCIPATHVTKYRPPSSSVTFPRVLRFEYFVLFFIPEIF